jgi:hypothetical protein
MTISVFHKPPRWADYDNIFDYQCQALINDAQLSMQQSVEWSMHTFCTSFPHINHCAAYEEHGDRELIVLSFILIIQSTS